MTRPSATVRHVAPKRLREEEEVIDSSNEEEDDESLATTTDDDESESEEGEESEESESEEGEESAAAATAAATTTTRDDIDSLRLIRDIAKTLVGKCRVAKKSTFTAAVAEIAKLLKTHRADIVKKVEKRDFVMLDGDIVITVCPLSDSLARICAENTDDWLVSVSDDIADSCGMEVTFHDDHLQAIIPGDD